MATGTHRSQIRLGFSMLANWTANLVNNWSTVIAAVCY